MASSLRPAADTSRAALAPLSPLDGGPRLSFDGERPFDSAELLVQSRRRHGAGLMPEGAGFVKVSTRLLVVTSVVVEHGHRLQDGCRAAEMTQAPGYVQSLF